MHARTPTPAHAAPALRPHWMRTKLAAVQREARTIFLPNQGLVLLQVEDRLVKGLLLRWIMCSMSITAGAASPTS